ncbi:hypothetical protein EMM73_13255 [Rheinheimera sediminis]|uniref:hypothetical protein n=1 Tax=Rheinheimera sp. YQF-1 TaxID=2499626 RepID=UPI000FDA19DC|nr:hypothetical protein [Rheinheimera sp. YQF-1]RVT45426.1 hypothetical protein EMM73_13255 [Rheinheimera sp. YQF-1]
MLTEHRIFTVFICASVLSISSDVQSAEPDQQAALNNEKVRHLLSSLRKKLAVQPDTVVSSEAKSSSSAAAVTASNSAFALSAETLPETSRFNLDEELIISLRLGNYTLSEVLAYQGVDGLRFGLANLMALLNVAINYNLDTQQFDGWIYDEQNRFELTVTEEGATGRIGSNAIKLTPEQFGLLDDDFYLSVTQLQQWFGLTFRINEESLTVYLDSDKTLPIEARLARQGRQIRSAGEVQESVMPWLNNAMTTFSRPLVDLQLGTRVAKQGDNTSSYSLLSTGDLVHLNSELYLTGNDKELVSDGRLKLAKDFEATEGGKVGLLSRVEFGDVTPVSAGFTQTLEQSRGLYLTNASQTDLVNLQKVNITGEVQNGWDVELYRNGALIAQQLSIENGRYEFNDIELYFGNNDFEIVRFGPEGQVNRLTQSYYIDGNSTTLGSLVYDASYVQLNKSMLGIRDTVTTSDNYGYLFGSQVRYGVTNWLSLGANFTDFKPDQGENLNAYGITTDMTVFNQLLYSNGYRSDSSDNISVNHSLRSRIYNIPLSFSTQSYKTKDDPELNYDTYAFGFSADLFKQAGFGLTTRNSWTKNERSNGSEQSSVTNSLSLNSPYGTLSNAIRWTENLNFKRIERPFSIVNQDTTGSEAILSDDFVVDDVILLPDYSESVLGSVQYRNSIAGITTRIGAGYAVKPYSDIISYDVSLSKSIQNNLNLAVSFNKYLQTGASQYSGSISWLNDMVSLRSYAAYSELNGWVFGLSARTSFGTDPAAPIISSRPLTSSGSVVARVYEDKNNNQQFDEGEKPVVGAVVRSLQTQRQSATDARGFAVMTSMQSGKKTDIVLDRRSLDDPFMLTTNSGVAVTPRKGLLQVIDFPVTTGGEIEGRIYSQAEDGDAEQPVAYIQLQLMDKKNNLISSTQSEFDGYYLFNDILPGQYFIRVDPKSSRNKNLRHKESALFSVKGDGAVLDGADFALEQMEFTQGFSVDMGRFNSLVVLKAFWGLVGNSGMNVSRMSPFYLWDKDLNKYQLKAAFLKEKNEADAICARLKARGFSCDVNYFEFKL